MSRAPAAEVLRQLIAADIHQCCRDVTEHELYLRFVLDASGRARLATDDRFASGLLHGLHADVGDDREDYRSHTGVFGKGSLQIVCDRTTGAAYADVDRWSPYADVVGFLGHAFWEVVPGWFRKRRKTPPNERDM